jgi:D-serine deaminase-like pyridoxal phosphate-dependent protein
MTWYHIQNISTIDSPALVIYKDRVQQNISKAIGMVQNTTLLRPHVKTNKISEVCTMMMAAGISKFKCATIAEAEMLARLHAKDVLLAYQPVGPKAERLLLLTQKYPDTRFSCLVDNRDTATHLSNIFSGEAIQVFIDINVGMNRTGTTPAEAFALYQHLQTLPGIHVRGLHAYDGHINDSEFSARKERSDRGFSEVLMVTDKIKSVSPQPLTIVAGGSPTFGTHIDRGIECSPGTFVFWDWAYHTQFPDEPFELAALVITRVISIPDGTTITTDLGHKSIAAENPQPRVHFLNAPDAMPVSQSEEHLVVKVKDSSTYKIGDLLYGVPMHICPTVALYEEAFVVEHNSALTTWKVVARDRKLTI